MALNRDFSDLFAALNAAEAEYLLVGGYALAVHATPRFTKDLDVWVNPTRENAARVLRALSAFGAPLQDLTIEDLSRPDIVFQMGLPPNRIDVLTRIDGVEFPEAWPARITSRYGALEIPVISRRHLVQNKRASGRPQDLVDAELLLRTEPPA
ncbi:MAG TPA: hypothetical protein VFE30_05680 [Anaeromyxobacteraceae bacterium]|jgi:hypothetical protein|nr:hypothetical protein [Anaeromyxobacteraceae bacterium]